MADDDTDLDRWARLIMPVPPELRGPPVILDDEDDCVCPPPPNVPVICDGAEPFILPGPPVAGDEVINDQ